MIIFIANFTYLFSDEQLDATALESAEYLKTVSGLVEKTYLVDSANRRCGGVYKFEDRDALDDYLASDFWAGVLENPEVVQVETKTFDVHEAASTITRGIAAAAV